MKPAKHTELSLLDGQPFPLGASVISGDETVAGVNFAVWAPDASAVELCLYEADGVTESVRMTLPRNSEGVWHGFLAQGVAGLLYGFRAHGLWAPELGHRFNANKLLLDPWAKAVFGSYGRQQPAPADDALIAELDSFCGHSDDEATPDWRDNGRFAPKAIVVEDSASTVHQHPDTPMSETVLYEAHVRSLTKLHPEIPQTIRGSYAALAHPVMLAYYARLGITALSLLPVHFRADERALQQRGLANHWGYSTLAFFAPETRYASDGSAAAAESELKAAIATLHEAGIEVILDVVYNHTAEMDEFGPTLSMRGLANARYYHLQKANPAFYENWTGCGNALDLSEPRVTELVISSLRHWVTHYGVDGFRFDLAPVLGRGEDGKFSNRAGFFAALQADPVLSRRKLIAEPWDIGPGGYQLGGFPVGWREWNDKYRDLIRGWWLRDAGTPGAFAHAFAGSATQFNHHSRDATSSVNFITAHDGFTLRDLVSYEKKHNKANGENNRDGHGHNNSNNCGVEGETADPVVLSLRTRLQRALLTTLFSSQGTPMLLAGDEMGQSQAGNNNAYCQDNELSWLDWSKADSSLLEMTAQLIHLRHKFPALRNAAWLTGGDDEHYSVQWRTVAGKEITHDEWNDATLRSLSIELKLLDSASERILIMVNASKHATSIALPAGNWDLLLDSSGTLVADAAGFKRECLISALSVCLFCNIAGKD